MEVVAARAASALEEFHKTAGPVLRFGSIDEAQCIYDCWTLWLVDYMWWVVMLFNHGPDVYDFPEDCLLPTWLHDSTWFDQGRIREEPTKLYGAQLAKLKQQSLKLRLDTKVFFSAAVPAQSMFESTV